MGKRLEFLISQSIIEEDQVKPKGKADHYVLELYWMHGDGDHFETTEVYFPRNKGEEALTDLLDLTEQMVKLDRYSYYDLEDFTKWFYPEDYENEEEKERLKGYLGVDGVYDTSYNDGFATLNGSDVKYYDVELKKHDVFGL